MKKFSLYFFSIVLLLFSFITVEASSERKSNFTDVKQGEWYYDAVAYSYDKSLMLGMTPTTFEPNTRMSRAMFVTVLARLSGAEESAGNDFTDVADDTWYSGAVGWAAENGIVDGFPDGTFRPDDVILREQMAAIISRFLDYERLILPDSADAPEFFSDEEVLPKWADYYIDRVSVTGIILGDEHSRFNPKNGLTRAEAATLLMRLSEMMENCRNAVEVVTAWDMINSPASVYSNMSSDIDTSGEYPEMCFDSNGSNTAPWYFGLDIKQSDINESALSHMQVCYRSDSNAAPVLKISSPAYETELEPETAESDGEYSVLNFDICDAVLSLKYANLTSPNPYAGLAERDSNAAENMKTRKLLSRYFRIGLYPFADDSDASVSVKYIAFSSEASITDSLLADEIENGSDAWPEPYYAELTDGIKNQYAAQMNSRIDEILSVGNNYDPEDITGTCYYVSSVHGTPGGDGFTPETAFDSITDLYIYKAGGQIRSPKINEGDAVFFERGSVFYAEFETNMSGDYTLPVEAGVIYTTYGEGDKPIFTTALDLNGSMEWVSTKYENVWRLAYTFPYKESAPGYYDIGNIIIDKDGVTGWGIKILPMGPANPDEEGSVTVDNGVVSNGFECFDSPSRECRNPGVLQNNLEFLCEYDTGSLYMYYDGGNPGEYFDRIIVSGHGDVISGGAHSDFATVLDNLAVMYTGSHGISVSNARNFTIENCVVEWVGGTIQETNGSGTTRLGNGIQNWNSCDGFYIKNSYVNQVYDGGISSQFEGSNKQAISIMNDIEMTDCVVTNTNSHIEMWNYTYGDLTRCMISNMTIKDNYLAYGGYHFGHQREKKCGSLIYLGRFPGQTYENSVIENNVCMYGLTIYAGRPLLSRGASNGTILRNNVYINSRDMTNFGEFQEDFLNDRFGSDARELPRAYTEEVISELLSLGIDRGSKFYYYDGYLFPEEAEGVYHPRSADAD